MGFIKKYFWSLMFWLSFINLILGYFYPNIVSDFNKLYSMLVMVIAIGFDRLEKGYEK